MIQLDEKTALDIEDAAILSMEQYGDAWNALNTECLKKRQFEILKELNYADNISLSDILKSAAASQFLKLCVELSVIRTLLTTENADNSTNLEWKPQIYRDSDKSTPVSP